MKDRAEEEEEEEMVYGSVASFMVSGVLVLELLSTVSEMQ